MSKEPRREDVDGDSLSQPFDSEYRQNDQMASEGLSATLTSNGVKTDTMEKKRELSKEKELERIYHDHVAMVYNLCYKMLHNRADAQDATQEVFVKVYKNLNKFAGRSKISTWIYRIAMNHCIDRTRRKKLKTVELAEWIPSRKQDVDARMALDHAVTELPPSYRSVFVLHDIQGFRHAEIGKILNITPGSSKSLLHRSRRILRDKLKEFWRKDE